MINEQEEFMILETEFMMMFKEYNFTNHKDISRAIGSLDTEKVEYLLHESDKTESEQKVFLNKYYAYRDLAESLTEEA